MEQWKKIEGYDKYYISDLGRVRSEKFITARILKPGLRSGYPSVVLSKDNKQKNFTVHRLVAIHFVENPEGKTQVNHINGIKEDSRAINLEWCTKKENTQHALSTGLIKRQCNGVNVSKKTILEKDGETFEFPSSREAARFLGCAPKSVERVCRGERLTIYKHKAYYA